jgi:hypothetical protein
MSGVVPHFLTRYKPDYRVWGWTALFDRVSWLTLAEAREFTQRSSNVFYTVITEDDVRSKLVANELMK